jgi:hypothetical protein
MPDEETWGYTVAILEEAIQTFAKTQIIPFLPKLYPPHKTSSIQNRKSKI